jgi:hypothetical protein
MPRLVLALPKYRLYKGSGKAVDTLNGKDHYLGRTAQLLADASTIASSANPWPQSDQRRLARPRTMLPRSRSAWPTFATLRATTAPVRPANATESFGNYPFDSSK